MSQPVVELRVADPVYVHAWLQKMFKALCLRPNKIHLELVQGETDKQIIRITRRG